MTKEEIIAAIAETIAPNNIKGITADSLANILTEIVNASGESGGGSGSLVVYIGQGDLETGEMSQTAEQKAHNADVFKAVKSAEVMPAISVEISEMYSGLTGAIVKASAISPMNLYVPEDLCGIPDGAVMIGTESTEVALISDGTVIKFVEESNE